MFMACRSVRRYHRLTPIFRKTTLLVESDACADSSRLLTRVVFAARHAGLVFFRCADRVNVVIGHDKVHGTIDRLKAEIQF